MVLRIKHRHHADNRHQDEDPITKALAPPANETEVGREARLATEREAQRISNLIDDELNRQRLMEKKTKCVRVLLLGERYPGHHFGCLHKRAGQSESGMQKSVCLRFEPAYHFRSQENRQHLKVYIHCFRVFSTMLDMISHRLSAFPFSQGDQYTATQLITLYSHSQRHFELNAHHGEP